MPFTTVQYKKLVGASIPTALTTQYTVPASAQDVVKDFDISNGTGASVSVSLYLVASGGSALNPGNILLPSVPIPANGALHWTGTQVLNTGDTIQTSATATGCTLLASGIEST